MEWKEVEFPGSAVDRYNRICNGAWAAIRFAKSKRKEVAVFVLTWEQRDTMLTVAAPHGPFQPDPDGPHTLFGVPVLAVHPEWKCPSNLEDLRSIK